MVKNQWKKNSLTPEEKTLHTGNKDRSTICFLSEVVQARRQWNASWKCWKRKVDLEFSNH